MKLVILITAKNANGMEVAQAWQDAGAPGITIMRTYGIQTIQDEVKRGAVELPRVVNSMSVAMAHVLSQLNEHGEMLLCVIDDHLVNRLVEAASAILGDLTERGNGVLFVLPVERAIGVVDHLHQHN